MASRDIIRHRTPLSRLVDVLTVAFLAAFLVWTVLPLVIMVVSSFKDLLEAFALPPVGKWSEIGLFSTSHRRSSIMSACSKSMHSAPIWQIA
jgi:multiple sugar transport system permease protein